LTCICLKQTDKLYLLFYATFHWSRKAGLLICKFNLEGVISHVSIVLQ